MFEADLVAGDRHVLNQDRTARPAAAREHIAAYGNDTPEHVFQFAGNRDFLYRMANFAALDPVACRAARVIARHEVHALAHQLGDEKPALEFLQHAGEVRSLGSHHEIVVTACIAGGFQAELARRVAAEEIAFDDAVAHHRTLAGVASQRLRLGELRWHASGAEPVVALHQALVLGDHRARDPVPRAGIAAHEAEAVREDELRLVSGDGRTFRVAYFL